MTFVRRYINITFVGPQTVKVTNHRTTARIRISGDPAYGIAEVGIYGMSMDVMNQLATFGQPIHPQYNYQLLIEAGDEVNGMSQVFKGQIQQAWADFQSMPDVPFHVMAYSSGVPGVMRNTTSGGNDFNSYSGSTDCATMLQTLAGQMGCTFENGGVNVKLDSPYHFGSPMRQAQLIREAADLMMVVENGVLAAWPQNQARPGQGPTISKTTGMIAEPSFTEYGVLVKVEFTTYVKYGINMTIQSIITPANGQWSIVQMDYDLASLVPNGHWFATLYGTRPNVNIPYVPQF